MDAAPPPSNLSQTIDNVRVFISKQIAKHRHVVLVTVSCVDSYAHAHSRLLYCACVSQVERVYRWREIQSVTLTTSVVVGVVQHQPSIHDNKTTLYAQMTNFYMHYLLNSV